jgi:uncharacterized integral membrane protein (TIGR00698 family)
MQQTTETPAEPGPETVPARPNPYLAALPGIVVCLAIATAAWGLGRRFPVIGGPVFGILIGMIVGNVRKPGAWMRPGLKLCGKQGLKLSIILLGGALGLREVWRTGSESLVTMLITLAAALVGAFVLGRLLGVSKKLTSLVGVGTGICGGSAIAAVAPVIDAEESDIAFSISTIFLFNVVAVLAFPALGHAIGMTDTGFGLWAGTAINDTSSVVAAAGSWSEQALDYATVTKLARTTMIVPIAVGFAILMARRRRDSSSRVRMVSIFPWFILGFLAMSLANTSGLLVDPLPAWSKTVAKFLIVVALAGVGLGADFANLRRTGPKPVLLGLLVWALVAVTSLAVQWVRGGL